MSAAPLHITSLQNPHIKNACALRERRHRDQTKLFVVEGYREVRQYLRASAMSHNFQALKTLFFCSECFLGTGEQELIDIAVGQGTTLICTSKRVFERLSYRDRPDGLLGIAPQWHRDLSDLHLGDPPFIAIAQGIEKPGNLGTLLRCGDGAGLDALIVIDRCTDLWNPNTVRASIGTLFSTPVVETDTKTLFSWLKKNGLKIVAATPEGTTAPSHCDLKGPCAIALGSEQFGLSSYWRKTADACVAIPMKGSADSLNIAIAGALLFYEVRRQRDLD